MSTEVTVGCYTASVVSTSAVVTMNGVKDILSIVCMVITILGITVPAIIKLIAKIKRYLADKKLTPDELEDIANDVEDILTDVKDTLDGDKPQIKVEGEVDLDLSHHHTIEK